MPIADGLLILAIGLGCMAVLEVEKALLRRWRVFDELASDPTDAADPPRAA